MRFRRALYRALYGAFFLLIPFPCLPIHAQEEGLVLHLDASRLDPATEGVSVWPDLSGMKHHMQQEDSSRQPRLMEDKLSGKPVIHFDGTAYLDGPPMLSEGDRTFSIVAVWKRNHTKGAQAIWEQASEGIGRRASLLTVHGRYGFNGQNNDQHDLVVYLPGQFNLSLLTLDQKGTVRLWHNDNKEATGAKGRIDISAQNVGVERSRLGAKITDDMEYLIGDIAEIMVYDHVLEFDEIQRINEELGTKWNIGIKDDHGTRRTSTMSKEKMDEGPDYTSRVPKFEFSDTLEKQEEELKDNPLLKRFKESREGMADDPWRPTYHYVNPEGSLNDPNGLCRWKGRWHLFYQAYPPEDPRQHWGHAVSHDLIHWRDLPYAIYPSPEEKCFSGATFVEEDRVIAMYHGTRAGNMAAVSSDPLLLNWEKVTGKPVIPSTHPDGTKPEYNVFDPCIWKKGDFYYSLSAGTLPEGPRGRRIRADFLLRSRDLANWEYLHPFVEGDRFTLVGDDGACPYFWPIGDQAMLLFFSHMSGGQYLLGEYDEKRDKLAATSHGKFNFGAAAPAGIHAPSATLDGEGNLIVIFNMNPGKPTKGWNQIMSLPRRLSLLARDLIAIDPAGEVESLRRQHDHLESIPLPANQEVLLEGIQGKSMEVLVAVDVKQSPMVEMNVLRSPDKEEFTRIAFFQERGYFNRAYDPPRRESLISIDSSYASVLPEARARAPETAPVLIERDEPLQLRVFLDRSVVEVFVNGKQCLAVRVYPEREDSHGISLRSQGRDAQLLALDAWQMENIYP